MRADCHLPLLISRSGFPRLLVTTRVSFGEGRAVVEGLGGSLEHQRHSLGGWSRSGRRL
jgi:hypothetical protein